MVSRIDTNKKRIRRHKRVRGKIFGTAQKPRLCVFRSLKNIYAQVIDDESGKTLASASSLDKEFNQYGGNKEAAKLVGQAVAKAAIEKGIPPAAAYALELRRKEVRLARIKAADQRARELSAGKLDPAEDTLYSPDEVRAMPPAEVRKNIEKIRRSMKSWR